MSFNLLILGASGYIGGTFLHEMLKSVQPSKITALVRIEEQRRILQPLGINVVVGKLEDIPLLTSLVAKNDVVANFAVPFAGGDESIQAIVDTLEREAPKRSIKPVLLQTTGTGGIMYGSGGVEGTDVWRDTDYERWESLPATSFFQSGNRIVAKAAEKGVISAFIIASPTVYGKGLGPGNTLSLQIPAYVRYAKRTGRAAYNGKGENIWGNVHVEDLVELYRLILEKSLNQPESTKAEAGSHGWSNLIYGGVGQHTWKPVVELIGDLLHARGEIPEGGAISIGDGDGDLYMFGTNSFMVPSEKAKQFGWSPKQPELIPAIKLALPASK